MPNTQQILKLKQKPTSLPLMPAIRKRFSPRVFSQEKIPESDLKIILEAGRWAPSSYNRQPWFFYVAKKDSIAFEKLAQTLVPANNWAEKSPILILACAVSKDEIGKNNYAEYDLGQSVAYISLQAQELGYFSHQMAGFDKNLCKKLLQLPEEHKPKVIIAVGRIGEYDKADPEIVKKDLKKPSRKDEFFKIL